MNEWEVHFTILRPVDPTGDVLPVLSSGDLLSGPEAVAQLVKYRLFLLTGEWWETPEAGFFLPEQMREGRITEADAAALSSAVTAYIRETDGVQDVEKVTSSVSGRRFMYSCEVRTREGNAAVSCAGEW